ncbi:hypothetical protein HPB47_024135 [Ixodes persulcatus]|uniref:Uncharacterized protein n=1 Tax=Ixodes persulcatus TaxID=34615 RepID=A0AC60Q830_IXOPE|nr:hypothetical protein HPB47_024135 [Ixodes persulcatus]
MFDRTCGIRCGVFGASVPAIRSWLSELPRQEHLRRAKKRYTFLAKWGVLEVVRRRLASPSEHQPSQVLSKNLKAVARKTRGEADRLSNDLLTLVTRSSSRRKERAIRPKPIEEPSTSKEQQVLRCLHRFT